MSVALNLKNDWFETNLFNKAVTICYWHTNALP